MNFKKLFARKPLPEDGAMLYIIRDDREPTIPWQYNEKGELLDRLSGEPIDRLPLF